MKIGIQGEPGSFSHEAALKLVDVLPEDAERRRTELAIRNIEAMLAFVLYGASSNQRELAIRRLCELGDQLGESKQLVAGRIHLSILYFTRGEALRGIEVGRRALELAEDTKDVGLIVNARFPCGQLAYSCGRLQEALVHFEKAIANRARARNRHLIRGFSLRKRSRVSPIRGFAFARSRRGCRQARRRGDSLRARSQPPV